MAMDPKYLERAIAYWFRGLLVRWPAGQSDQRHRPALVRPLAGEQNSILTNRAEIRREPVADVDEPLRLHRVMLSDGKSARRRSRNCADAHWLRCSHGYSQHLAVASCIAHQLAADPGVGRAQPID